jgi:hypothetical protein
MAQSDTCFQVFVFISFLLIYIGLWILFKLLKKSSKEQTEIILYLINKKFKKTPPPRPPPPRPRPPSPSYSSLVSDTEDEYEDSAPPHIVEISDTEDEYEDSAPPHIVEIPDTEDEGDGGRGGGGCVSSTV